MAAAYLAVKGLTNPTSKTLKPATLRVTAVKLQTRLVAAIIAYSP